MSSHPEACAGCKGDLPSKDYIRCPACKQKYDLQCASISPKKFKTMNMESKRKWRCVECHSKIPKTDNTETPVRTHLTKISTAQADSEHEFSSDGSYVAARRKRDEKEKPKYITEERLLELLKAEKREMKALIESSTKSLSGQLNNINEKCVGSNESLSYVSKQYDDMRKEISDLKALLGNKNSEMSGLKEENKALKENLGKCVSRIKTLEEDNLKQQQWVRLQNLEFVGVPENKEEITSEAVLKITAHMGLNLQPSDIEFAHRVQPMRASSAPRSRPIIVRWRQRATKDIVLAAARKHHNLTAKDVGIGGETSKIFVNEHLTKDNKMLLSSCKQRGKECNYKFTWTKNCRIYTRKNETSPPILIASSMDLEKIA